DAEPTVGALGTNIGALSMLNARRLLFLFFQLCKYHSSSCSLQNTRDRYLNILPDKFPGIFNYDHSAIIKVGNTLVVFLPFFDNKQVQDLSREHYRLEHICKFIDIQYCHALQLRHLVQVEIIGDNLAVKKTCQGNKFGIHLFYVREILFDYLDL